VTYVFAALRLPLPIVIAPAVIGLTADTRVGPVEATVRVGADQSELAAVDLDDLAITQSGATGEAASAPIATMWDAPTAREPARDLRRLLFRVSTAQPDLGPPRAGIGGSIEAQVADALTAGIDRWFDIMRTWVEILTMQDLDHVQRRWDAEIEGAGLATFRSDGTRLGHGGRVRVTTNDATGATVDALTAAFRAAGEGRYPPLPHTLLRDARAAWSRGQHRRALIDASTALELALTDRADELQLRPTGRFWTLGTLVEALRTAGELPPAFSERLVLTVVHPRNDAAHRGVGVNGWDTANACKLAQLALARHYELELVGPHLEGLT
jgi:hypothetical protein